MCFNVWIIFGKSSEKKLMTISFPGSQGTIATAAAVVTVLEGTMATVADIAVAVMVTVAAVVTVALVVAVSMLILVMEDRVCLLTNWSRCCK